MPAAGTTTDTMPSRFADDVARVPMPPEGGFSERGQACLGRGFHVASDARERSGLRHGPPGAEYTEHCSVAAGVFAGEVAGESDDTRSDYWTDNPLPRYNTGALGRYNTRFHARASHAALSHDR